MIGIGGLLLGLVLMAFSLGLHRPFFRRRREVAPADALDGDRTAPAPARA